jgi:hypothetical protein
MNRLPLCMGGCGKYPYVDQWHLWNGGYCNNCWKSHLGHLDRMKQIRKEHEWLSEQQRITTNRQNLFLFTVFGILFAALITKPLWANY